MTSAPTTRAISPLCGQCGVLATYVGARAPVRAACAGARAGARISPHSPHSRALARFIPAPEAAPGPTHPSKPHRRRRARVQGFLTSISENKRVKESKPLPGAMQANTRINCPAVIPRKGPKFRGESSSSPGGREAIPVEHFCR